MCLFLNCELIERYSRWFNCLSCRTALHVEWVAECEWAEQQKWARKSLCNKTANNSRYQFTHATMATIKNYRWQTDKRRTGCVEPLARRLLLSNDRLMIPGQQQCAVWCYLWIALRMHFVRQFSLMRATSFVCEIYIYFVAETISFNWKWTNSRTHLYVSHSNFWICRHGIWIDIASSNCVQMRHFLLSYSAFCFAFKPNIQIVHLVC